ncbi:hypothetical protein P7C73_g2821, partial [Tremellales sp. Uapishka_1]
MAEFMQQLVDDEHQEKSREVGKGEGDPRDLTMTYERLQPAALRVRDDVLHPPLDGTDESAPRRRRRMYTGLHPDLAPYPAPRPQRHANSNRATQHSTHAADTVHPPQESFLAEHHPAGQMVQRGRPYRDGEAGAVGVPCRLGARIGEGMARGEGVSADEEVKQEEEERWEEENGNGQGCVGQPVYWRLHGLVGYGMPVGTQKVGERVDDWTRFSHA